VPTHGSCSRCARAPNEETLIEFLGELHDHLDGDKVTIIWEIISTGLERIGGGAQLRLAFVTRVSPHDLSVTVLCEAL
jgi:hypothetical protein